MAFVCVAPALSHSRNSSKSSLDEFLSSQAAKRESIASARPKALLDYSAYMANYINSPKENSANSSPRESPHSSPGLGKKVLPGGCMLDFRLCVYRM